MANPFFSPQIKAQLEAANARQNLQTMQQQAPVQTFMQQLMASGRTAGTLLGGGIAGLAGADPLSAIDPAAYERNRILQAEQQRQQGISAAVQQIDMEMPDAPAYEKYSALKKRVGHLLTAEESMQLEKRISEKKKEVREEQRLARQEGREDKRLSLSEERLNLDREKAQADRYFNSQKIDISRRQLGIQERQYNLLERKFAAQTDPKFRTVQTLNKVIDDNTKWLNVRDGTRPPIGMTFGEAYEAGFVQVTKDDKQQLQAAKALRTDIVDMAAILKRDAEQPQVPGGSDLVSQPLFLPQDHPYWSAVTGTNRTTQQIARFVINKGKWLGFNFSEAVNETLPEWQAIESQMVARIRNAEESGVMTKDDAARAKASIPVPLVDSREVAANKLARLERIMNQSLTPYGVKSEDAPRTINDTFREALKETKAIELDFSRLLIDPFSLLRGQ